MIDPSWGLLKDCRTCGARFLTKDVEQDLCPDCRGDLAGEQAFAKLKEQIEERRRRAR